MTRTGLDQSLAARVVVRVLDRACGVVGAGFLAGSDVVATCAHVVADALGADPYGPPPAGRVRLDLPLLVADGGEQGPVVDAEVLRWQPIAADGSGDVAILQIHGPLPPGARMPPLRRVDRLWNHSFRVLGFPDGMSDGVWATGRIRGEQGTRWFQLQATAGEQPIVGGFSGTPVWDEESGAVVGMTVAADASGATTTAYLLPIDQVLGLDPELLPCPYRGLEPFGEEHSAFFFGRDADIAQLAATVAERPLVAVAGPSGAGKSSLVRAGLLPRLRAAGDRVAQLRPLPGTTAVQALVTALDAEELAPRITDPAQRPAVLRELAGGLAEQRTVLVADQFEELAAGEPTTAQELLALIGELVSAVPRRADGTWPVRAVLTLRSATIDEVLRPGVARLLGTGTVLVPPMERRQLRDAIVAPAERAPGLSFEPGLVDRILDDAAAEPGRLPLVESLLTELWERRDGGTLTVDAYERAGGVAGVVAMHAEDVVARFTDPADGPRLRRLFTALAVPDRDGRFARRPLRRADLALDLEPLIAPLVAGRLLVVEHAGDGDRIQLAHQALIAHWPRLRDWLTADRDFLAWRDQLEQQRDRWEVASRDDGALLRGSALAVAQEWLPDRADDVSVPAREYVDRSRARQRREIRRWRLVTAVLAVLVLAAGALATVAVSSRNQVQAQLRLANAEVLGQAALTRLATDTVTAAALALTGWQANPDNAAVRTALARLAMATQSVGAVFPEVSSAPIGTFGVSDDGRTVVVREDEETAVVLLGMLTGAVERWEVPGVPAASGTGRVSPDGRYLAVPHSNGALSLWNIAERTGPVQVPAAAAHPVEARSLSFSPDSTHLTWVTPLANDQREFLIWNLARAHTVPHGLGPISGRNHDVDFLPGADVALMKAGHPIQITARSRTDGSVRHVHAPDSILVEPYVVSCAPGEPGVALVRRADSGEDLRRVDLLTDRCTGEYLENRLSAEQRHLVEPRTEQAERDVDVFRITSLVDGRRYDLAAPPNPHGVPGEYREARTMAVVPAPEGGPTVLQARGRSFVTMRAGPDTGGTLSFAPDLTSATTDGRYLVARDEDHVTVLDPAAMTPLSQLRFSAFPDAGPTVASVSDRLTALTATPERWAYTEFALPSLAPFLRFELPRLFDADPMGDAEVSITAERVALLADGILTTLDRTTGEPLGAPIVLASNAERYAWFRESDVLAARPGPVPQVAVVAELGTVELWNPVTGVRDGVLESPRAQSPGQLRFDRTGTRLVAAGLDRSVQTWDVDRREPVGPPLQLAGAAVLKGIDADGYLVVSPFATVDDPFQLTFWDLQTGLQSGSVRISEAHDPAYGIRDDGRSLGMAGTNGALPFDFPLTAGQWVEQLCAFTDRPFTVEERALLPAGTEVDSPCAKG